MGCGRKAKVNQLWAEARMRFHLHEFYDEIGIKKNDAQISDDARDIILTMVEDEEVCFRNDFKGNEKATLALYNEEV